MNKMLFVVMVLSLVVVLPAFGPKCPGGLCPPPTKPPPVGTKPPPVETQPPPEETNPPPVETEKPKNTEPVETVEPGVTPEGNPNPKSPNPKGGSDKELKVISLPKSGYGPVEEQNKDILGYILIVAVLGLTVIILGGMIKKNPED